MIILFVLLIIALIMWIIFESLHVFEEGAPAKDQDILEMLELKGKDYEIYRTWDDKFLLKPVSYKVSVPHIHQTKYSILFPYYISNVGVIPVWYKSAKVLDQMFEEKTAVSKYKITKRDKLGLN